MFLPLQCMYHHLMPDGTHVGCIYCSHSSTSACSPYLSTRESMQPILPVHATQYVKTVGYMLWTHAVAKSNSILNLPHRSHLLAALVMEFSPALALTADILRRTSARVPPGCGNPSAYPSVYSSTHTEYICGGVA